MHFHKRENLNTKRVKSLVQFFWLRVWVTCRFIPS